jgi:hypothetical protein
MKFLIAVVLLVLVFFGAQSLIKQWKDVQSDDGDRAPEAAQAAPETAASAVMAGLPPYLEASLDAARRQGADALKVWLKKNRGSVQDPRLADIELDYVAMVGGKNFGEAREVFQSVKARISPDSPVYPKVKKLERTYQ